MTSEDQELDDLLDNALSDFDKKLPANLQPASDVTIQKVNLYVDDVDYEDRPKVSGASAAAASPQQSKQQPSVAPNHLGAGLSSILFNSATSQPGAAGATSASASNKPNIDDDMKMFEEIFGDAKTKASMQSLRQTLDMFKEGDETKLLENFDKVMSQITDTFKVGDLPGGDKDDNDDDDDDSILAGEENEMLRKMLADMQEQMKKVSSDVQAPQAAAAATSSTAQAADSTPLNPSSFFNAEFLSKLSKSTDNSAGGGGLGGLAGGGDDDDGLDESEAMFMQPLLSMLFSKDILYPSLKMMLENFDKHLEEKKNSPESDEEIKKLREQRECVVEMCEIYDRSKPDDSKQAKSEQMKRIIELLEKCGMPPSELVPEVNPFNLNNSAENGCPIS